MRTMALAALVLVSIGCRSGELSPAPTGSAPATSTAAVVSSVAVVAPAPDSGPELAPLPDLATRSKLLLHQGQGGPALVRLFVLELRGEAGAERYGCREPRGVLGTQALTQTLMAIVNAPGGRHS